MDSADYNYYKPKRKRFALGDDAPGSQYRGTAFNQRDREAWLNYPVCDFGKGNQLTVHDTVEGTQIFGDTGAGKTTGSCRAIAVGMLRAGYGGVVLAAKVDELDNWMGYFRDAFPDEGDPIESGRLAVLSPTSGNTFNPFAYQMQLGATAAGIDTRHFVSLFTTALGSAQESGTKHDPYWDETLQEMLTHAVDLVAFSKGSVASGTLIPGSPPTFPEIMNVVVTAPQSPSDTERERLAANKGACVTRLRVANKHLRELNDPGTRDDLKDTLNYWLQHFPSWTERTRSVVVSSFTSKCSGLLRRPLRQLLCGETCGPVSPTDTFKGQVVLLDLPYKQYGATGYFAQTLYKTVWQHAVESTERVLPDRNGHRPVFLWVDEAQNFIRKSDILYQATARSRMAATVYVTQNVSNYDWVLTDAGTRALINSLLTRVFHASDDQATWKLCGEELSGLHRSGNPEGISEAFIQRAGKLWNPRQKLLLHRFRREGPL